jgi:beta-glucosidase
MQYKFPEGFDWGVATASYQIEGAWNERGKGESIWDRFTHIPGHVDDDTNGDVACDFYHRYEDDIKLAASLGIKWYRLSISWPRIQPDGTGPANEEGIAFYRRVLECLHKNGIKSAVTMYHWDLPQKLQDRGGWTNREIVGWFKDYAKILYDKLGDLVDRWITLNEPFCASIIGYWYGEHAPGYHDIGMALQAVHHLMMAHGTAVQEYRKTGLKAEIGITLNMNISYPFDPKAPKDVEAAKLDQLMNDNLFGDAVYLGKYPEELFSFLKKKGVVLPDIRPGDMELIKQPLDFFGLNTYSTNHIKYDPSAWPLEGRGCKTGRVHTDVKWEVNPQGMYDLLKWVNERYKMPKVIITENGEANNDWVSVDGKVHDPNRIDYLERYRAEVNHAIKDGVPVKGYFVWCFTDNFEWARGYSIRFGIVHTDYKTQKRTPKDSAYWYSNLVKNNGF